MLEDRRLENATNIYTNLLTEKPFKKVINRLLLFRWRCSGFNVKTVSATSGGEMPIGFLSLLCTGNRHINYSRA